MLSSHQIYLKLTANLHQSIIKLNTIVNTSSEVTPTSITELINFKLIDVYVIWHHRLTIPQGIHLKLFIPQDIYTFVFTLSV